jgi:hypothetical protein
MLKHDNDPPWRKYCNRIIASEISSMSRYYDRIVQWQSREDDSGMLLDLIDCADKVRLQRGEPAPDLRNENDRRTIVLINGTLNHHYDAQALLSEARVRMSRTSRAVLVLYNPYFALLYRAANWLGVREGELPSTFITETDLRNIARLSGYEIVRVRPAVYVPWRMFGLGRFINAAMPALPLFKWLGFVTVTTLRPVIPETGRPSLSVVIPARNERGNIKDAIIRMPDLGCELEVIFVEGHSSDGTWDEIQRVVKANQGGRLRLKAFKQTGKGKGDAVRLGFSHATGDLLTILDADLTMPPELLGRFYEAYCEGLADFINGTRLTYPMEGEAMRFLNGLGNVFFAKALSAVLDTRLGDALCGTKLLTRHDYVRMIVWRRDFGDFDPFGDFEILFPAAILALGVVDVPIRYRARTYGATKISRFRHGWMLIKMTLVGYFRIKTGGGP